MPSRAAGLASSSDLGGCGTGAGAGPRASARSRQPVNADIEARTRAGRAHDGARDGEEKAHAHDGARNGEEKARRSLGSSARLLVLLAIVLSIGAVLAATRPPNMTVDHLGAAGNSRRLGGGGGPSGSSSSSSSSSSSGGGGSRAAAAADAAQPAWMPVAAPADELRAARDALSRLDLAPLGGGAMDAFLLGVRKSTGTVEVVSPVSLPSFSYTLPLLDTSLRIHWSGSGPTPKPLDRSAEGFHHLGDVTLRVRRAGTKDHFTSHSTVAHSHPEQPALKAGPLTISADASTATTDATATLYPSHSALKVHRTIRSSGAEATVAITLTNTGAATLEIGSLGLSIPMNQMFSGRTLPQVARRCSFTEVYLGGDAGYVQVRERGRPRPRPRRPPSTPTRAPRHGHSRPPRAQYGAIVPNMAPWCPRWRLPTAVPDDERNPISRAVLCGGNATMTNPRPRRDAS